MSEVISFAAFQNRRAASDIPPEWTNSERAELYRVEAILHQSGITVETDEGVSDEGDPWFVFCRADGEVLIHIARLGTLYTFHSPALSHPLQGRSFSELCAVFQELFPLRIAMRNEKSNILFHPAAILSLVVGTIFLSFDEMLSTRAEAATLDAAKVSTPGAGEASDDTAPTGHPAPISEYHKAVEQFQSLADKNLKAVLGGRAESTQSQAYAALTTSLLIFAAGGFDAMTHRTLADEAKAEFQAGSELSERHDAAVGISFEVGVARAHDHLPSRPSTFVEDARNNGEHLLFAEASSDKHQTESVSIAAERHVDGASALIQYDFSPHLKPGEIGSHAPASRELNSAHASAKSLLAPVSGTHPTENAKAQGLETFVPEEAKAQSQAVATPQTSEAAQPSSTSDHVAIASSHGGTATARVDAAEVLLASLPEALGSNLHFSQEPVKFMLEEWDKIDFDKEAEPAEPKTTQSDYASPSPASTPASLSQASHSDSLSEKLNAAELALYDKVIGFQAGGNLTHFDLDAKSQILKFVEKATDIDIIVSDHVIMFVDEAVHSTTSATPFMKIWETGDGEAISIVGVTGPGHFAFT